MKKVMAFVFAGVRTRGLSALTGSRSVAAVPFAGKYRLVDFTLSNCVNSELYRVAVLAQYAPHSLIKHVGRGEPWDLNRREGGVQILQPYERQEGRRWYEGTADALRQNLDVLDNSGAERVFVLSSELVYKMDYSWMLGAHVASGAGVTIAVGAPAGGSHYGFVELDDEGIVRGYREGGESAGDDRAFMGVYLFESGYLRDVLASHEGPNLFLDCVRPRIGDPAVRAYRFLGDWQGVATVDDYLLANQRLLESPPVPDLEDDEWRIVTRSEEMPPVWLSPEAEVIDSLLSNGAAIEGRVERSILSPGVHVSAGAVVRDSVILNHSVIGPGAIVERTVSDKHIQVGQGARIGGAGPVTVIGKRAAIDPGTVIEPGTEIPAREWSATRFLESGVGRVLR